jgi:hypothetical protein
MGTGYPGCEDRVPRHPAAPRALPGHRPDRQPVSLRLPNSYIREMFVTTQPLEPTLIWDLPFLTERAKRVFGLPVPA